MADHVKIGILTYAHVSWKILVGAEFLLSILGMLEVRCRSWGRSLDPSLSFGTEYSVTTAFGCQYTETANTPSGANLP